MPTIRTRRTLVAASGGLIFTCLALAVAGVTQCTAVAQQNNPRVQFVDAKGLKAGLSALKGKVVLVNFWATWCGPCVKEFPDVIKLQKEFAGQGLVVAAVSLDEPEDKAEVTAFAEKHQAPFPIFARSKGSMEAFAGVVDRNFGGAIPATYLIGRDGKRVGKAHVGQMSFEDLKEIVEPQLKKPASP